jgi:TonB family protein
MKNPFEDVKENHRMGVAALLSFVLHFSFIPFFFFFFYNVGIPNIHTKIVRVSFRPMEIEKSPATINERNHMSRFSPPVKALEKESPIDTPKPLPFAREGEDPGKGTTVDAIASTSILNQGLALVKENLSSIGQSPSNEASSSNLSLDATETKERILSPDGPGEGNIEGGSGGVSGVGWEGILWKSSGRDHGNGPRGGRGGLGDSPGSGKGNVRGGTSQKGPGLWGKLFSSRGGSGGSSPHYFLNPKPSYPHEAREKGYEGGVLLKVEILPNGLVGQIEVKRSSGHEILDWSALSTVRQWRFVPARKGGQAIPFWVNIPIKFLLQ